MDPMKSVPFARVEKLRGDPFKVLDFRQEPRHDGPDGNWRLPEGVGDHELEKIWVDNGWFYILYSREKKTYWLTEIEGPDHGVCFYGPFKDEDGSFYREMNGGK